MAPLMKRDDNNGFLLPESIIVLLIILGAGFFVCCGYAIHSAFGFGTDDNGIKSHSASQYEYMAEVRARNMDALARTGARSQGAHGSYAKDSR